MQNALVNVNGQILRPEEAKVGVFDRSYLYGDSLYEVVRTWEGKILFMPEHLERLEASAALARMKLSQGRAEYQREIIRTLEAWQKLPGQKGLEAYCRLIVSRGEGKIGFGLSNLLTPTQFTIIAQPLELPSERQLKEGLSLAFCQRLRNDARALDPAMKSGNYLNSLLAFLESTSEGFEDAILCNADGHVTEGTTYNVGYFSRGILTTPPLDIGILAGITRAKVIEVARQLGISVREVRFPKERMFEASEVFALSTTKDIFPVTLLNGRKIGNGRPGPLTFKVREAFQAFMKERVRHGHN
jgi:branched-chain amino acid aminotransferase